VCPLLLPQAAADTIEAPAITHTVVERTMRTPPGKECAPTGRTTSAGIRGFAEPGKGRFLAGPGAGIETFGGRAEGDEPTGVAVR
jgi:hypothetical protein